MPIKEKPKVSDVTYEPVKMTEIVLPSHTNERGTIFGGMIMSWIDIAGAIAAKRFCRSAVVTVSIDYLHFIVPIKIGYTVMITAWVTYAGKTSMEVEVVVEAENSITGEIQKATHAYLTYVSVDESGKPRAVPKFIAKTEQQKKSYIDAQVRRKIRLSYRE